MPQFTSLVCLVAGIALATVGNLPAGAGLLACGVSLALASVDPVKHWTSLAGGLLLWLAVPVVAWIQGWPAMVAVPGSALALAGVTIFTRLLLESYAQHRAVESVLRVATVGSIREALEGHRTEAGVALNGLIDQAPALLVFLRHTGCTFCRQTLADLAAASPALAERGVQVVLVHHSSEASLQVLLQRYQLPGVHLVHDPQRWLYRHFGLARGSAWQVGAHPLVLLRTAWSLLVGRHGMNRPDGDARQMPGAFALFRGRVLNAYYHRNASERPDYLALCAPGNVSRSMAAESASNGRGRI